MNIISAIITINANIIAPYIKMLAFINVPTVISTFPLLIHYMLFTLTVKFTSLFEATFHALCFSVLFSFISAVSFIAFL